MTTFPDGGGTEVDPADDGSPGDGTTEEHALEAFECPNGHLSIPAHPVCPTCGESPTSSIDVSDERATIVSWTTSTATPPGVRSPNHVAIVEFDVDGRSVRTIGQLTTDDVSIGTVVEPVYVAELR
ncbi:MAG: Zn-ribbon domain-containing OB-fold protein, partial [Halodesulfurarchaeum sp.]